MTISHLDVASRGSTRRQQDAGQVKVLSENAIQGATSSSSAPASPPSARASDLELVVPVEEVIHFGSFNGDDPACNYYKPASEVTKVLDQESVEEELRTQSKTGGISRNEEEKVKKFARVPDDEEIKRECLGSESEFLKKMWKELLENFNDSPEDFLACLFIRQVFSEFREREEGQSVDARMKKKHKILLVKKGEKTVKSMLDVTFTRLLTHMIFQAGNTDLKSHFSDHEWRERHRFPKFENETVDYHWWKENFDPDIVKKRLKYMKKVTEEVYPHREYFSICQTVSCLNFRLHPLVDSKTVTEMAERKVFVRAGVDVGPAILSMLPVVPRNKKI